MGGSKTKKIGVGLIVVGLILLVGSSLLYFDPTLGHRAALAFYEPPKGMTAEVAASSESEVPVILDLAVNPLFERHPGAMAVAQSEERLMAMAQGLSVAYNFKLKDVHPWFGMVSGTIPLNQKEALLADPRVVRMAMDRVIRVPTPFEFRALSEKEIEITLELETLWAEEGRGEGVAVAVLDSGVDERYVDVKEAWGVLDGSHDLFGHGTAVCGIIRETAPEADVYSIRVLDEYGMGRTSDIIRGLEMALENIEQRPLLVNMSLGTLPEAFWDPLGTAARMAAEYQGVIITAAAGNTGTSPVLSPASSPGTIAVGALDASGEPAEYTSYGPEVDTATYGDVVVQWGAERRSMRGTSFAAPRVCGLLACKLSGKAVEDVDERELVRSSCVDIFEPGRDPKTGWGLMVGSLVAEAPLEEEQPLGGKYPLLVVGSSAFIVLGVVLLKRGE